MDSTSPRVEGDAPAAAHGLHFVWTRDIDQVGFGRLKMARAIRDALSGKFAVSQSILCSLGDQRSAGAIARALLAYARSWLMLRPLPLQCLLYADSRDADRVIAEIPAGARAVYLDGVRCVTLLRRMRRRRPDLPVVTDLDDLMSRRMQLLLELNQPPSTGYMRKSMPRFVEAILGSPALARLLLRYESRTLKRIEAEVVRLSDRTVLLSPEDARVLAAAVAQPDGVVGIGPPAPIVAPVRPLAPGPIRFVFVGSDTLRQNQLTIDRLVTLWREHELAAPLVVYGEQTRSIALPAGVTMPGFADTLAEIYDGRSVLVSPSYLAGGIKTKVLESFGHGTAVIGNAVTFEGVAIGDYPLLAQDDAALLALLRDPQAHRARFDQAARHGAAVVRQHHDPDRFAGRWIALFKDAIGRAAHPPATLRTSESQSV